LQIKFFSTTFTLLNTLNHIKMTIDTLLKNYAAFNLWANRRLVEWIQKYPVELKERETPSSFPSLKLTLLHIWSAEKVWMERLQQVPPELFLALTFTGSSEEVCAGLLQNSAVLANYIEAQEQSYFDEVCDFRRLDGTEDRRERSEMLLHCVQHSTYHRGQLVTMGRAVGLIHPPKTDYMAFGRVREKPVTS